jgi:phospholipid-binding lipoprotein MlaA
VTIELKTLAAAALVAALAGCSSSVDAPGYVNDPYIGVNREFHAFNKQVDTYALRPVANAYDIAAPGLVKLLASNALDTLDLPGIVANHVLQGEFLAALRSAGRLGLNIVVGAGGLLDPATEFGLPKEDTDFGITLARAGAAEGPYLELPLLGPATGRDLMGRVGDMVLSPMSWITGLPDATGPAIGAFNVIEARQSNLSAIDRVLYESEDSYIAVRSFYTQARRRQVAGDVTAASLPDVFAE